MAALPDDTDQFWFLDQLAEEPPEDAARPTPRRAAEDDRHPAAGRAAPDRRRYLRRWSSDGDWQLLRRRSGPPGAHAQRPNPDTGDHRGRGEPGHGEPEDFAGSDDDTLPGLGTIEQIGARFQLPAAPVSPAPTGHQPAAPRHSMPADDPTADDPTADDPPARSRPDEGSRAGGVPSSRPQLGYPKAGRSGADGPPWPVPHALGSEHHRGWRSPQAPSRGPVPTGRAAVPPGCRAVPQSGHPEPSVDRPGPRSGPMPAQQVGRAAPAAGWGMPAQLRPPVAAAPLRRLTEELPGQRGRVVYPQRSRRAFGPTRKGWEARYVRLVWLCDLFVGLAAGGIAFAVRFSQGLTGYTRWYLLPSLLLPLVLVATLALCRAYDRRLLFVGTDEYQRVLRAGVSMLALVAVGSYLLDVRLARGYLATALPLCVGCCLLLRFVLRRQLHRSRRHGRYLNRVIVVGHELAIVSITRQLRRERFHGFKVVGCCLPAGHDGQVGVPIYGTLDQVPSAVQAAGADTVIVLSCPELDGEQLRRLAWKLEGDDVDLIVASSLLDVAGARTTIRPVDGLPLLHVDHPRLTGTSRILKSVVDRVGAVALLLALAPVLAAIAVAVRLGSVGPVLFHQVRVGKHGREFRMHKFRTMHTDAEDRLASLRHLNNGDGVLFKMRDDPRVTRVGKVLRRLSLDELPQLVNVVRGEMSLVGPRPPLPAEVAVYPADMLRRLAVRPGLTGLWQVSGRADLSWEEAVRLDLRYVENWSLSLDLVIMLRTVIAVWRSSGAY